MFFKTVCEPEDGLSWAETCRSIQMSNPACALARPMYECLYRKAVDDYLRIMRITSARCLEKISEILFLILKD